MKALILVGGYGTRLRPLTLSVPKPLVEFCNKPILEYQVEALSKAGVTHIILALAYKPDSLLARLQQLEQQYQVKLECSVEDVPLGTAGAIRLARDSLLNGEVGPFFVCNSDVICDFPLQDMLAFHRHTKAEGTILVTTVDDPSRYGVVLPYDAAGRVKCFVEKPVDYVGSEINAGIYILNPGVIDKILLQPTSIEKEVFPAMAKSGNLFKYSLKGYWADIGHPKDYLKGLCLHLTRLRTTNPDILAGTNAQSDFELSKIDVVGNVLIHPDAQLNEGCKLGPNVTVSAGCTIGAGVRLSNCALFSNVQVGAHAVVSGSIIGWSSKIGRWTRVEGLSVIGEDVYIADELCINQATILPHKAIQESVMEPDKIIM